MSSPADEDTAEPRFVDRRCARGGPTHLVCMSFGPKEQPRECPACHAALPLPSVAHCPVCGALTKGPGDVGKAIVDAMTDVLADPLGVKKKQQR